MDQKFLRKILKSVSKDLKHAHRRLYNSSYLQNQKKNLIESTWRIRKNLSETGLDLAQSDPTNSTSFLRTTKKILRIVCSSKWWSVPQCGDIKPQKNLGHEQKARDTKVRRRKASQGELKKSNRRESGQRRRRKSSLDRISGDNETHSERRFSPTWTTREKERENWKKTGWKIKGELN